MIYHFSIAARQPAHVADVIAELWRGRAYPFPPTPGSHIAFAGDARRSAIEVYPLGTELVPGDTEVAKTTNPSPAPATATHAAIATPLTEAEVHAIAEREGWRSLTCDRGGLFRVIEVWLENRLMLELLTDEMQAAYLASMTTDGWEAMLAGRPASA